MIIAAWESFQPAGPRVLMALEPRPEETRGGIILPPSETTAERLDLGTGHVLALGDHVECKELKVGDRVAFRTYLQWVIPIAEDSRKIFLINVQDLLMVVPEGVNVHIYGGPVPTKTGAAS